MIARASSPVTGTYSPCSGCMPTAFIRRCDLVFCRLRGRVDVWVVLSAACVRSAVCGRRLRGCVVFCLGRIDGWMCVSCGSSLRTCVNLSLFALSCYIYIGSGVGAGDAQPRPRPFGCCRFSRTGYGMQPIDLSSLLILSLFFLAHTSAKTKRQIHSRYLLTCSAYSLLYMRVFGDV